MVPAAALVFLRWFYLLMGLLALAYAVWVYTVRRSYPGIWVSALCFYVTGWCLLILAWLLWQQPLPQPLAGLIWFVLGTTSLFSVLGGMVTLKITLRRPNG